MAPTSVPDDDRPGEAAAPASAGSTKPPADDEEVATAGEPASCIVFGSVPQDGGEPEEAAPAEAAAPALNNNAEDDHATPDGGDATIAAYLQSRTLAARPGYQEIQHEARSAKPQRAVRKRSRHERNETDDRLLPPPLPDATKRNGETPSGRIRSCMCREPGRCRAVMWRWARLREATCVYYQHLPHARVENTPVGRHVTAYREAVLRHLGYTGGCATRKLRKTPKKKKEASNAMDEGEDGEGEAEAEDTPRKTGRKPQERIALVHFHPSVRPYLLDEKDATVAKADKYRIPPEVARKIGLGEADRCPTRDRNDSPSYYAVPTYTMDEAEADVEQAETEYKQIMRELQETTEEDVAADPSRYAREMQELQRHNDALAQENEALQERIKRETAKQSDAEERHQKLQKGLEKMTSRVKKWEATTKGSGRPPKRDCGEVYKEATGRAFVPGDVSYDTMPAALRSSGKPRGGRRWSDKRMDRAVEAKWTNPTLSAEEALQIGGFDFPSLEKGEKSAASIVDADNVTLAQRKNNLARRLRLRRNAVAEISRKWGRGGAQAASGIQRPEKDAEECKEYVEEETKGLGADAAV